MELGKGIQIFFAAMVAWGVLAIMCVLVGMMVNDSPYQLGRPGSGWLIVTLASGVTLLYSGILGALLSVMSELESLRLNHRIACGVFGFLGLLSIAAMWTGYEQPVQKAGDWTDVLVAVIGSITASLAVLAYFQCWRYLLRARRLQKPYLALLKNL